MSSVNKPAALARAGTNMRPAASTDRPLIENDPRLKIFCQSIQTYHPLHPLARDFLLSFFQKLWLVASSRLDKRGASRSSRTLRRDAVGVSMLQRGFIRADERR
jgi:hypothetical protein